MADLPAPGDLEQGGQALGAEGLEVLGQFGELDPKAQEVADAVALLLRGETTGKEHPVLTGMASDGHDDAARLGVEPGQNQTEKRLPLCSGTSPQQRQSSRWAWKSWPGQGGSSGTRRQAQRWGEGRGPVAWVSKASQHVVQSHGEGSSSSTMVDWTEIPCGTMSFALTLHLLGWRRVEPAHRPSANEAARPPGNGRPLHRSLAGLALAPWLEARLPGGRRASSLAPLWMRRAS